MHDEQPWISFSAFRITLQEAATEPNELESLNLNPEHTSVGL